MQGGVHHFHLNMVAQVRIALQQPLHGGVLIACVADQVHRDILVQGSGNALGLVRKAVNGLIRQVDLR